MGSNEYFIIAKKIVALRVDFIIAAAQVNVS